MYQPGVVTALGDDLLDACLLAEILATDEIDLKPSFDARASALTRILLRRGSAHFGKSNSRTSWKVKWAAMPPP